MPRPVSAREARWPAVRSPSGGSSITFPSGEKVGLRAFMQNPTRYLPTDTAGIRQVMQQLGSLGPSGFEVKMAGRVRSAAMLPAPELNASIVNHVHYWQDRFDNEEKWCTMSPEDAKNAQAAWKKKWDDWDASKYYVTPTEKPLPGPKKPVLKTNADAEKFVTLAENKGVDLVDASISFGRSVLLPDDAQGPIDLIDANSQHGGWSLYWKDGSAFVQGFERGVYDVYIGDTLQVPPKLIKSLLGTKSVSLAKALAKANYEHLSPLRYSGQKVSKQTLEKNAPQTVAMFKGIVSEGNMMSPYDPKEMWADIGVSADGKTAFIRVDDGEWRKMSDADVDELLTR